MQHALLTCRGVLITPEDLRLEEQPRLCDASVAPPGPPPLARDPLEAGLEHALVVHAGDAYSRVEEHLIRKAHTCTRHNQVQAAQLLGITRHVLRHRMKQCGLL
jgi:sigma-54-specific transcriptional regulator